MERKSTVETPAGSARHHTPIVRPFSVALQLPLNEAPAEGVGRSINSGVGVGGGGGGGGTTTETELNGPSTVGNTGDGTSQRRNVDPLLSQFSRIAKLGRRARTPAERCEFNQTSRRTRGTSLQSSSSLVDGALRQIARDTIPAATAPVNACFHSSSAPSAVSPGRRRPSNISRTVPGPRRSSAVNVVLNVARSIRQQGREFESVYTNHRYTSRELDVLASHDSFDYLPGHSAVYRQWLRRQPARLDWDRWLMMGLIGTIVGIIGFLLHQITHLISDIKWHRTEQLVQQSRLFSAWLWTVGFSVLITAASAASVAFAYRPAGGSGIPEVIGFLNGTVMRQVLNLPAFCVKFFSCSTAVGAGLPVGPEGPMIHIGCIVGNGLSQFRSRTFNIVLPFFTRFRNSEDRRNFTTAGAAAGVAAAFGAPVGGLLFAMEEVSSYWNLKLGWMIFFCCMLASFTADLFNSSLEGFKVDGLFGLFQTDKYIIFKLGSAIPVNVIMFAPAMLLGFIGGLLGALFTVANIKMARFRRRLMAKIQRPCVEKIVRFIEPPVIMLFWATITLFLPAAFPCKPMACPESKGHEQFVDLIRMSTDDSERFHGDHAHRFHGNAPARNSNNNKSSNERSGDVTRASLLHCQPGETAYFIDDHVQQYWCQKPDHANGSTIDGEYNELASLLNVNLHDSLRLLFSRKTHYQFSYSSLLTALPLYFFFTCWASGSAVASGIVVPMLFIGGLYGRAIGRLLVDAHGGIPTDVFWHWIDPGAMALIGAASFFGGVSRLTMSLTVIMIEITNDVAFLLPIMVAILMSKWVGDYITHPLYHSLLELKCIPFLESEPIVYDEQHNLLNLELFQARDVMHQPVITINPHESVAHLAKLVLETTHGGFPVVKYYDKTGHNVAYGLITRTELCVILSHENTRSVQTAGTTISPRITYEELSVERLSNNVKLEHILEDYARKPLYSTIFLDLEQFINQSAPHIAEDFSLHRTYIVFRTLGLRHLVVVDMANQVVGIITRKDLMGFSLERKLELRKRRGFSLEGGTQHMLPSESCLTSIASPTSAFGGIFGADLVLSPTSSHDVTDHRRNSGDSIV